MNCNCQNSNIKLSVVYLLIKYNYNSKLWKKENYLIKNKNKLLYSVIL